MAVYAIVPVKKITFSKKRLSKLLDLKQRKILTVAMLKDVVAALKSADVAKIVLVSSDLEVKELARELAVLFFSPSKYGLNFAVDEASKWCVKAGADSVIIIPADIPLISKQDINLIIQLGNLGGETVVLSPSNCGGTNALFLKPPNLISASFGYKSFQNHYFQSKTKKVAVKIFYSRSVAIDIDDPKDLQELFESNIQTESKLLLEKMGFANRKSRMQ
jgi:2-phospho-L-lactate/phosphoenolpyruvate guanylyltransferase